MSELFREVHEVKLKVVELYESSQAGYPDCDLCFSSTSLGICF
jgi:hypothetical protein